MLVATDKGYYLGLRTREHAVGETRVEKKQPGLSVKSRRSNLRVSMGCRKFSAAES